jgi:hypothetical protein
MTESRQTDATAKGFRPISLDAINFLLADVRGALGPYLNVFLVTRQHWNLSSRKDGRLLATAADNGWLFGMVDAPSAANDGVSTKPLNATFHLGPGASSVRRPSRSL